ncbi:Alpha-12-fucosyltransferase [Lactococcus cremoris]|uniref:Glycosyltransferase n=2 Tax=Lactococcus TaxID=1357 RepID=A0A3Q9TE08_9LACT|nr:alpha-1,2-fucosyltransferase [Lactococcus cremoris]AZY91896.1 glycosyltransferase [Lactococcus lactis]AAC45235.1 EpsH [Lactococcus cremoris]AZY91911.1 glycosyltransferase [Lactococcus lactis]AZY91926.1 glycosyltransferase [Lactococcus lactis]AZY91941.1 glycosyltransferase [Lactococcus lactis]
MIYVEIRGNLGNQLFIYATAKKIQKLTGQKIQLNTTTLNKYFPNYKFGLSEFIMEDPDCFIESYKKLPWFTNEYLLPIKIFKKILNKTPKINKILSDFFFKAFEKKGYFIWRGETFKKFSLGNHKNYYLSGFWQSEEYFYDIRDELLEIITPINSIRECNFELLNLIRNSESICVSIRRGDYVDNPKISAIYNVCDINYFIESVNEIKKNVVNVKVICFSDDVEWVKKNIKFDCETHYETYGNSLSEKVQLMSSCKHFVLSNSSFSWWTEFLSIRGGITIAPKNWYADEREADIYRKNWIYLEDKTEEE